MLGSSMTTKANRLNELPGREIESIITIRGNQAIDAVACTIFTIFRKSKGKYALAPSLLEISESKTRHLRYSIHHKSAGEKRVFVINIRERDSFITLKRKGPRVALGSLRLRAEEEVGLPYGQWTKQAEQEVMTGMAQALGIHPTAIFLSRETYKKKLKVRVINSATQRVYTVGITEKHTTSTPLAKTIVVEYIGKELAGVTRSEEQNELNALEAILNDLANIQAIVSRACAVGGIEVAPS